MRPLVRTGVRVGVRFGAAVGAVVLLATGCTLPGQGPDAGDAADTLAAALSKGTLSGVPIVGGAHAASAARTAYHDTVAALLARDQKPSVRVGDVSTHDRTATAELDWSWALGQKKWTYRTHADLQKSADGSAWQVRWSPSLVHSGLTAGERPTVTTLPARRGQILGAHDRPLVSPRPVLKVGLDKSRTPTAKVTSSATRLARLVGIDVAGFVKLAKASGPQAFVPAIVYRQDAVPPDVQSGLAAIPGAGGVAGTVPLAPTKDFAAALLGTVGPATADIVKHSSGRVQPGDEVGLSGLQKRYDEQLAGTNGEQVGAAGEGRSNRRVLFTTPPVAGKPLRTTLDLRLQSLAQQALAQVAPASALVAIRPSTGDLVAVASGPGSKGYNTASYGRYAPGSTFKIVTSLALLRAGESPSTKVPCQPTTVVDGKRFKNYSDYPSSAVGTITLEDALANSCNTAFISQHGRLGATSLQQAAAALGFGVDHDTGFPSYFGDVGKPASTTQSAASMIGQGTVTASPMAMATVVASVLKGAAVLPRLLPDVHVAPKAPAHPLTAAEDRQLRTMMRAVVERGSGVGLADLPGPPVIAKTGTAEFGDKPPLPTHAWMVAGQGDLAVAVFVDLGHTGSQTAGPVLEQFLRGAR